MHKTLLVGLLLASLGLGTSAHAMALGKGLLDAARTTITREQRAVASAKYRRATAIKKLLDPKQQSAEIARALRKGETVFFDEQHFVAIDRGKPKLFKYGWSQGNGRQERIELTIDELASQIGEPSTFTKSLEDHARALNNRRSVSAKVDEIFGSPKVLEAMRVREIQLPLAHGISLTHWGMTIQNGGSESRYAPTDAGETLRGMHSSNFQNVTARDVERALTLALKQKK